MNQTDQFLDQLIAAAHPQMVEALYLAAVPNWFTPDMFAALRQRDDGREAGILERFSRYAFIERFNEQADSPIFTMRAEERDYLQRRWLQDDPDAYCLAQAQALRYWQENPDSNQFAQDQNILYHLLFVDYMAAREWLISRFRAYHTERRVVAIERLIETADQALTYLRLLNGDADLTELADLLTHLRARLAQLRGQWADSKKGLQQLWGKADLPALLRPYVARAYGQALAHMDDQAGAIGYFQQALQLFEQQLAQIDASLDPAAFSTIQAERGHTLVALGDAYIALATTARGGPEQETAVATHLSHPLRAFFYAFISLPLLVYLSFSLGRQVWRPRFWPQLRYLDWIIARLFAEAARYYHKAAPLLATHGQPGETVLADERVAFLYLAVGDPQEAEHLFGQLLRETMAPLGPYRRALVQVGLGEALLRLDEADAAVSPLQTAVPVLQEYEDQHSLANGYLLLAQAVGHAETAVMYAQQALNLYQQLGQAEDATHAAEHLAYLETAVSAPDDQTSRLLPQYSYPVRYRHPTTILLQRLMLVLLTAVVFLIPVTTIRLETGTSLQPQISFSASPLLSPTQPDFTPQLSQGVVAIRLQPVPNPEVVVWLALLLFASYLLISTLLGVVALLRTSPATVQAARQERTVRLSQQQLQVGEDSLPLQQVTCLTRADVYIWQEVATDHSQIALEGNGQHLVVQAKTHWYEALADRLEQVVPATAQRIDLSYHMLRSKLGGWYMLTLLALGVLAIVGLAAPPWMMARPWGQPYSLVDLYPFIYVGLVVPPLWWFVIRPLQIHAQIIPDSTWPWWFGGAALLLTVWRVVTGFRPWFTIPDIYPPLLVMVLLIGTAVILWQRSHYAQWQRGLIGLVTVCLLLPHLVQLSVDLVAYHYLVTGHAYRDRATQIELTEDVAETAVVPYLQQAIAAYSRAYELSSAPLLGVDRVTAVTRWGVPPRDQIIWLAALNGRAAIYSQLGHIEHGAYRLAIDDYMHLTRYSSEPGRVFASLALTYQSMGTVSVELGETSALPQAYAQTIASLEQAIRFSPQPQYHLWLAVAYHGLDELMAAQSNYLIALEGEQGVALTAVQQAQAYTGLGWIAYSQNELEAAEAWFKQAIEADPNAAAQVGLGHLYYNWRDYEQALTSWHEAARLDPTNPAIPVSLGTLYWRLGTLLTRGDWEGDNPCGLPQATVSQELQIQWCWEQAIHNLETSLPLPGQTNINRAYTYRTMAQVNFLLRDKPDYEVLPTLQRSVDLYSEAIALAPQVASYWHMRGRLQYAVWQQTPAGTGPAARVPLLAGLADQEQALALDDRQTAAYQPQDWFELTYRQAVIGTLAEGDRALAVGNWELAEGYYELVAINRPERAEAAFRMGLVSLIQLDEAAAEYWYAIGLERAKATGNETAVQSATTDLENLVRQQPNLALPARAILQQLHSVDVESW